MNCREFREIADSYLGDELLVETNHEVLRHLETCAECRRELAARRELHSRVRAAIKKTPEMQLDAQFRARLQNNLRESVTRPTFWEKIKNADFFNLKSSAIALGLLLLVLFTATFFYIRRNSRENLQAKAAGSNQNSENINAQITADPQAVLFKAMQTAVGDHLNCAIKFRLAEKPVSLNAAAAEYGSYYKNLDKTVMTALKQSAPALPAGKIELVEAHSCIFQGTRFAHIIVRYHNRIVSILVAGADQNFGAETNDQTIQNLSDGAMRASTFRAADHPVFVVSALPDADNQTIARQIQPAVRQYLERFSANADRQNENKIHYGFINFP